MRSARLLGVFAHPDDEVFCAGGTLARYVAEGCEAMIVSATRGEAGQVRDAGVATRRTLGAVREAELRTACTSLGAQHVRLLSYKDGELSDTPDGVLKADIAAVMAEFRPDVVITFGADGAYGHPDHVAVGEATDEAFVGYAATAATARLYHSHFPRSRLLLLDRLATWLTELNHQYGLHRQGSHGPPSSRPPSWRR